MVPIFAAIAGAIELFNAGRQVYEAVAGSPSKATTVPELQVEVAALPPEQAADWAKRMELIVSLHRSENDRIRNDQGDMTPEILRVLDPKTASTVAVLRMTTRPWVVRSCTHVILLPVYVTVIDMAFIFLNGLCRLFGAEPIFNLFAEKVFGDGSIYVTMYSWAAPIAASVLITYITARAYEKGKLNGGADNLTTSLVGAAGVVKSLLAAATGKR
jgi:hypothetical protein